FMKSKGKRAALTITGVPPEVITIDAITDQEGNKLATRVSVSVTGTSARIVAVVADVIDSDQHSISRVPVRGNDFAIRVADKGVSDFLIVTPDGSQLVPENTQVDDAVALTTAALAGGTGSPQELL